ncbi:MAG: hypothetical protein Q8941_15260 [Bacteroidota bacterium]|nr:hypothetical protein [Bacteroidota bacterium]
MRWLLFLSRLSFICGISFLLSLSLLIKNWTHDEAITSTIIVIGHVIGMVVVPVTLLCYLGVVIARKKLTIPLWLVVSNILFLFVLLFYIIFSNGNRNP